MDKIYDYLTESFLREHVRFSLQEDLPEGDTTTEKTVLPDKSGKGLFVAREPGIFCGSIVVEEVFCQITDFITGGETVELSWHIEEGDEFEKDEVIGQAVGSLRYLLAAERVALNYLQELCGVAVATRKLVKKVDEFGTKIYDTRKTVPHHRLLQKYAVVIGGGYNHRLDLAGIMVKDNHKQAAGGIAAALNSLRTELEKSEVVVEIHSPDELKAINNFDIDVVMLDNSPVSSLEQYCSLLPEGIAVEVSGGIDETNVVDYARAGVDRISSGAITHSYDNLDVSFKTVSPQ